MAIGADGITLDLDGHTIDGDGSGGIDDACVDNNATATDNALC